MERISRKKTKKEIYLTDIYRIFNPIAAEYTVSQVHTEHFPGEITYYVTQQVLANTGSLKL